MLIASLTLGTGALFVLEGGLSRSRVALTAGPTGAVAGVEITFLRTGERGDPAGYDFVIWPDRVDEAAELADEVRVAFVENHGAPAEPQLARLLGVLRRVTHGGRLPAERVWINPQTDPRLHPELNGPFGYPLKLLVDRHLVR